MLFAHNRSGLEETCTSQHLLRQGWIRRRKRDEAKKKRRVQASYSRRTSVWELMAKIRMGPIHYTGLAPEGPSALFRDNLAGVQLCSVRSRIICSNCSFVISPLAYLCLRM